jgi:hypothetical protein
MNEETMSENRFCRFYRLYIILMFFRIYRFIGSTVGLIE